MTKIKDLFYWVPGLLGSISVTYGVGQIFYPMYFVMGGLFMLFVYIDLVNEPVE